MLLSEMRGHRVIVGKCLDGRWVCEICGSVEAMDSNAD